MKWNHPLGTSCLQKKKLNLTFLLTFASIAPLAVASEAINKTEESLKAYAAGYKAAFTCSATFNAGKSPDTIPRDELSGIYPTSIGDRLSGLPEAAIEKVNKRVSVAYSDTMPPRIAQWRPWLGCTQLPIGADAAMVVGLPSIEGLPARNAGADNGEPWTKRAVVNVPGDNGKLEAVVARAFEPGAYGSYSRTSAVLIATKDEIIAERYADGLAPDIPQRTWSVAKSLAATVIGAAVNQGLLDVKAPATIPEWHNPADPRKAITLENLLHMASGLDSDIDSGILPDLYFGGSLVTDVATETSLEAMPGTRFKYASKDTLLAIRALRAAMNDDAAYHRFPFEAVLNKIGMAHTFLETDWDGNFILSSQVWSTSRDLARWGLLHLQDGVWNGQRILPEGWVRYVTTPAPAQPPAQEAGNGPQWWLFMGYGAQWWLFNGFPGLPEGSYAALGHRGQAVVVIPAKGLVIVRRGYDLAGGEGFRIASFAADVVAALGE